MCWAALRWCLGVWDSVVLPAVAVVDGIPGGIAAGEIALWDALLLLSVWGPRGLLLLLLGKKYAVADSGLIA